jgi:hypothetical protein
MAGTVPWLYEAKAMLCEDAYPLLNIAAWRSSKSTADFELSVRGEAAGHLAWPKRLLG